MRVLRWASLQGMVSAGAGACLSETTPALQRCCEANGTAQCEEIVRTETGLHCLRKSWEASFLRAAER